MLINKDRVLEFFLELVKIDSESLKEGAFARHMAEKLKSLGFEVSFDEGHKAYGGETGNLIAFMKGSRDTKALAFEAHMDTVVPGTGINPVLDGDIIRSSGDTVLGGDDKSGIAAMLEAAQTIRDRKLQHGPVYYVLTFGEEVGLCGAKAFNLEKMDAEMLFVLDSSSPVGTAVISGPSQDSLTARFKGVAAHAGNCPEAGISSIVAASRAISAMKLGRIDSETTANIGKIQGGSATNIVPEETVIYGEARSRDSRKLEKQVKHMTETMRRSAKEAGAEVEIEVVREYSSYNLNPEDEIVRKAGRAFDRMGLSMQTVSSGGGSDTNIFSARGLNAVNLGMGMQKVHTTEEWISRVSLTQAAQLVLNLILE